jgi:hypothetical protein
MWVCSVEEGENIMNDAILERQFGRIGARVKTAPLRQGVLRINVLSDRAGEYFDLQINPENVTEILALNADPGDRHLLLLAKTRDEKGGTQKQRFLCGHDERAWFVASVPGNASNVRQAKEALKPRSVRALQDRLRVRPKDRNRRKNEAFVRQGEWFFIPNPRLAVHQGLILRNEPIRRGAGKPHMCEFLMRSGGQAVYVSKGYPKALTAAQHARLLQQKPDLRKLPWTLMRRDMTVYVKGRIRHPDHKTVYLACWHQVVPNTETEASAMRHLAFLD